MRRHIRRPSAALVVACAALFVALSGTSVATVTQSALPANSVGEVQIRDSAVTSAKVADETLQVIDLSPRARAALSGPAGPAGPAGAAGPPGPEGAPGVSGLEIVQAATAQNTNGPKSVRASCRGGRRVLGGGAWAYKVDFGQEVGPIALRASHPERNAPGPGRNRDGWRAVAVEVPNAPGYSWQLTAYAICAFVS